MSSSKNRAAQIDREEPHGCSEAILRWEIARIAPLTDAEVTRFFARRLTSVVRFRRSHRCLVGIL